MAASVSASANSVRDLVTGARARARAALQLRDAGEEPDRSVTGSTSTTAASVLFTRQMLAKRTEKATALARAVSLRSAGGVPPARTAAPEDDDQQTLADLQRAASLLLKNQSTAIHAVRDDRTGSAAAEAEVEIAAHISRSMVAAVSPCPMGMETRKLRLQVEGHPRTQPSRPRLGMRRATSRAGSTGSDEARARRAESGKEFDARGPQGMHV